MDKKSRNFFIIIGGLLIAHGIEIYKLKKDVRKTVMLNENVINAARDAIEAIDREADERKFEDIVRNNFDD